VTAEMWTPNGWKQADLCLHCTAELLALYEVYMKETAHINGNT